MYLLPSDTCARSYGIKIFNKGHIAIVKELSVSDLCFDRDISENGTKGNSSKISYSYDTWTTKQMTYSFACSMAFFIADNWTIQERLVDFKALEENDHKGLYAAISFVRSAANRGGLKKMSTSLLLILDI